ncbi:MAG: hypothetical protein GC137_04070 [Alphaproteobacteria bacterium]|nr:hypothetical protein [Alphaproteobacteria bacterium]
MEEMMSKTTTKTAPQFDKIIKDTADFGAQYSDACSKSSAIWMKGVEDIMSAMTNLAQTTAEKQAAFVKEAMGSKTFSEFAHVQNKMAQTSFDDFMTGATKISEISAKILTDSVEPVSAQMSEAVQKASKAMAA